MSPDRRLLLDFLQSEMALSEAAIAVALKQCAHDTDPLPMVLWQYGLLSLEELSCTFDWLSDQTQIPVSPMF